METIASAVLLTAVTLLAFAFALFLHWALLSVLFRCLPGTRRARSLSPGLLSGKPTRDVDSSRNVRHQALIHPASPSQIVR